MDSVMKFYNTLPEVAHSFKVDGALTALCGHCCVNKIKHSFTVYTEHDEYDIISFIYSLDGEIEHFLYWLEEKSEKV